MMSMGSIIAILVGGGLAIAVAVILVVKSSDKDGDA